MSAAGEANQAKRHPTSNPKLSKPDQSTERTPEHGPTPSVRLTRTLGRPHRIDLCGGAHHRRRSTRRRRLRSRCRSSGCAPSTRSRHAALHGRAKHAKRAAHLVAPHPFTAHRATRHTLVFAQMVAAGGKTCCVLGANMLHAWSLCLVLSALCPLPRDVRQRFAARRVGGRYCMLSRRRIERRCGWHSCGSARNRSSCGWETSSLARTSSRVCWCVPQRRMSGKGGRQSHREAA
eukprot:929597-Prymnesium_polylepis.1